MNLTKLADWVGENLYQAHRGSFVADGLLILFGNDGASDPKVVHELELVFRWIRRKGYKVSGFSAARLASPG